MNSLGVLRVFKPVCNKTHTDIPQRSTLSVNLVIYLILSNEKYHTHPE